MRSEKKTEIEKISAIARECGEIMLSAHSGTIESEIKTSRRDVVTEFDKKVQDHAILELSTAFNGAHFICEEGYLSSETAEGLTFVIDPIDGTTNFTHHYGHSCISIACLEDGRLKAAAVYDPFKDEMFTAEKGGGAFLNGERINVSYETLSETLVIFGTTPGNPGLIDETLERVRSIYGRCQDIRRTGSAALDLCYVAAGRAGLYFELELSVWDYAAGVLIVEEAGGKCLTIDGRELVCDRPVKSSIIAGSSERIAESRIINKHG